MRRNFTFYVLLSLVCWLSPQVLKSETAVSVFAANRQGTTHSVIGTNTLATSLKHAHKHGFVKKMVARALNNSINKDNYGVVSLILSIVGIALLLSFGSLINIGLGVLCIIGAIVFGIKGLCGGGKNRLAAILGLVAAGLAVGLIGLVIWLSQTTF